MTIIDCLKCGHALNKHVLESTVFNEILVKCNYMTKGGHYQDITTEYCDCNGGITTKVKITQEMVEVK